MITLPGSARASWLTRALSLVCAGSTMEGKWFESETNVTS